MALGQGKNAGTHSRPRGTHHLINVSYQRKLNGCEILTEFGNQRTKVGLQVETDLGSTNAVIL